MELVCPAGSYPALKAAVDNGANAVYLGFKDSTNARHFAGLNFTDKKIEQAIDYAQSRHCKIFIAINTYSQSSGWKLWQRAVDMAASLGVNAVILADMGVLDYASSSHPELALHLSVQGSATNYEALSFYKNNFGIRRAVLPRVLSVAQVKALAKKSPVELEVFGFGSLCIMAEGRCHLSSYVTGESPNMSGVCSPAKAVSWKETDNGMETRLSGVLIDKYRADEHAAYPTLCKGRFNAGSKTFHVLEEATSLNTLELLPELDAMGIKAIKIEGRQRSPAYVASVTKIWRNAIDQYQQSPEKYQPTAQAMAGLAKLSEGTQTTLGAYHRSWR